MIDVLRHVTVRTTLNAIGKLEPVELTDVKQATKDSIVRNVSILLLLVANISFNRHYQKINTNSFVFFYEKQQSEVFKNNKVFY